MDSQLSLLTLCLLPENQAFYRFHTIFKQILHFFQYRIQGFKFSDVSLSRLDYMVHQILATEAYKSGDCAVVS